MKGEILELIKSINTMVEQLRSLLLSEVTRVAREVGTEGEPWAARPRCLAWVARGRI